MFPIEIWEQILKHIDPPYLLQICTVNSVWKLIITKHLQKSDAWYSFCQKTIPRGYWLILLENTLFLPLLTYSRNEEISLELKLNYKIWLTMYQLWVNWRRIGKSQVEVVEFCKPIPPHRQEEYITALTVLGELIAVGSTEGYIRIYNAKSKKLVFRVDQYEQVKSLQLTIQGKNYEKTILLATSISGRTRIWDINTQKKLFHNAGDIVCAGYGYYCVNAIYDAIYVCDAVSEVAYPIRLFIANYGQHQNKKSTRNPSRENTENMCFVDMIMNKNELCFWSDNGLYCKLDLEKTKKDNQILYTPEIQYVGVPKNQKVQNYFLFNPYVMFCITERGNLGISVNKEKWKMYNVFSYLEGIITTVLYHVKILVFGLDSGDICIYHMNDENSLRNINLADYIRVHISKEPIMSIKLIEISEDQRLLVAAGNSVYYIAFN